MESNRIMSVVIDGEVANVYDSDEESAPQEEQAKSRFWGGKGRSKYPSKKGSQFSRNRKSNGSDGDSDRDDYNEKNAVEGSNYAIVSTAGNFRASTISALGMFSSRDILNGRNEAAAAAAVTPDKIIRDLTQSERELNEIEEEIIGYEEEEQRRVLDSSYATSDDNSGVSMASRFTKKKKKEMIFFYSLGIVIFLIMCGLFAFGGVIIYKNQHDGW